MDNKLEVWTKVLATGEEWPSLKVFEGRISSVDPGGEEIKIVCRDVCHDLTQLYIAPGLTGPATSTSAPPQPGGDEEEEVING